jgi:hypothetical protein
MSIEIASPLSLATESRSAKAVLVARLASARSDRATALESRADSSCASLIVIGEARHDTGVARDAVTKLLELGYLLLGEVAQYLLFIRR